MKAKKTLFLAAIVIFSIIFIVSAVYVGKYYLNSFEQKEEFDDLAGIVESIRATQSEQDDVTETTEPNEADDPTQSDDGTSSVPMLAEYAALYAMNQDIVGWISIDDTRVNYPVMQTPNSTDYYLHTNFKKQYSSQGCIYVRETCDVNEPSDNVTIYGHNMRDGSMFHALEGYTKESFWQEHDTIRFDTLTERHTYKIFAVFKTTASKGQGFAYHRFENAADEAEFDAFIATCKELAFYDTGITPVYGDKIICLSTCEYTLTNGRLVVAAYRVS